MLRRIVHDFDGEVALDCWVAEPGTIAVGNTVEVVSLPLALAPPGKSRV